MKSIQLKKINKEMTYTPIYITKLLIWLTKSRRKKTGFFGENRFFRDLLILLLSKCCVTKTKVLLKHTFIRILYFRSTKYLDNIAVNSFLKKVIADYKSQIKFSLICARGSETPRNPLTHPPVTRHPILFYTKI